jgi:phospholipid/cholesterol/gamma-HCH transport system substrate-binding protein
LKVGLFVLSGLICLAVFLFSINDATVFEGGKSFRVVFRFANGLKKNAPVRIAGVEQGVVKDVRLFFDRGESRTKAEVDLWIKKDVEIPVDSMMTINQLGLMGEKYIEIIPGIDTNRFYKDQDTVIGKDPVSQHDISQKVMDVADRLESSITSVNEGLLRHENVESLSRAFQSFGSMSEGLNEIIHKINEGEGTIGRLFTDAQVYDDLQGLLADLRTGRGTLGKFLTDEALYNNIEEFTADLKTNPWKLLYRPKSKK